jgi:hypothetical protein
MCIIAEDIAFINHACEQHANRWPAVWKAEEDVGSVQWQLETVKRGMRAGRSSSCAIGRYDRDDEKNERPCTGTVCTQR